MRTSRIAPSGVWRTPSRRCSVTWPAATPNGSARCRSNSRACSRMLHSPVRGTTAPHWPPERRTRMPDSQRRSRKRNKGLFKRGDDPRRRKGFSKEECRRGFLAALDACSHDWDKLAYLLRKVRSYYRQEKANGKVQERWFGPADDREHNGNG